MRNIRLLSIIIIYMTIISAQVFAQNLGIGPDTFDPDASAGVEMRFTNKGLLIPRVALTSTTDQTTIPSPATSLLVYNLGTGGLSSAGFYYWNGSQWIRFANLKGTGTATRVAFWAEDDILGSDAALYWDNTSKSLGIGDATPASLLTVGNGDLFQVNSSGNLVKINNITYSWPTSQGGASTFLQNNGSGTLTWTTISTHNQSHSMTSTSDHYANTWKMFYSNGSGYVQELSLGSYGTYLMSNGTSSAPTWATETDPKAWLLLGNSGTVDGTNFLGTTDNVPLTFKVNSQIAGKIDHLKYNTSLGYQTLLSNSTGTSNIAIGYQALKSNVASTLNIAIGDSALFTQSYSSKYNTYNIAIGHQALFKVNPTSSNNGYCNTVMGYQAGYNITTGDNNVFLGMQTGRYMQTGMGNVAIGSWALQCGSSATAGGSYNVAIGLFAMSNPTSGNYNVAIGDMAYQTSNTGAQNTFVGANSYMTAGKNASYATALGYKAQSDADYATAIGALSSAPYANTVILGSISGVNGASASSKVGIGTNNPQATLHVISPNLGTNEVTMRLGPVGGGTTTTPSRKSILDFWSTFDNHTDQGPRRTASIVVGFSGGAWGYQYMSFYVGDGGSNNDDAHLPTSERVRLVTSGTNLVSGGTWASLSDRRIKTDITTLHYGIKDIMKLQPIEFEFHDPKGFDYVPEKISKESVHSVGFIAQDVYEIIPEIVYKPDDTEKELWGMQYEKLTPILVKGIQEQQSEIENLNNTINQLKTDNENLKSKINNLTNENESIKTNYNDVIYQLNQLKTQINELNDKIK